MGRVDYAHVPAVAVRVPHGPRRLASTLVGYLWESGGRFHFAYSSIYRLNAFSVPLDPIRLPLSDPEGKLVFSSASLAMDGELAMFGRMVPGACADRTSFAWLSEFLARMTGGNPASRVVPQGPLTRLAWGTLLQTYALPMFGLAFDPVFKEPRYCFGGVPPLRSPASLQDLWLKAAEEIRTKHATPRYNANLLARGAEDLSDELRRWILPLPGSQIRARLDTANVPGYLITEPRGATPRHELISAAYMSLARDCGLSTARVLVQETEGRTLIWREAVLGGRPEYFQNITGSGAVEYDGLDDHIASPLLLLNQKPPMAYGWDTDPLKVHERWMVDTTDPACYKGEHPTTALIDFTHQMQMRGQSVDREEALRRVAFHILTGLFCLDDQKVLVRPRHANFATWFDRSGIEWSDAAGEMQPTLDTAAGRHGIVWEFAPIPNLQPALCPFKTAMQMGERLIKDAMGEAGKLGVPIFEATKTICRIAEVCKEWDSYASQFGLDLKETDATRPVIAYKENDILPEDWTYGKPRRGRKPTPFNLRSEGAQPAEMAA